MTNDHETPKKKRAYETEWAFSFDALADQVRGWLGQPAPGPLTHIHLIEPVGHTLEAVIDVALPAGVAQVRALDPASPHLLEADIHSTHHATLHADLKEGRKTVLLHQPTSLNSVLGGLVRSKDVRWDVRLSRAVPLDLDVNTGLGEATLDLTGLALRTVGVEAGAGRVRLVLPDVGRPYTAEVEGGVGELDVQVAAGAQVRLKLECGLGTVRLHVGAGAALTADVETGLGGCTVTVPPKAAMRLEAETGLGRVDVPDALVRAKPLDDGQGQVWRTAGYELAARRIDVRAELGMGSFAVRFAP